MKYVTYNGRGFSKSAIYYLQSDPPFACGAVFDGSRDGYIDLGPWSPGPKYTIAAWVRPAVADGTRRVGIKLVSLTFSHKYQLSFSYFKFHHLNIPIDFDIHKINSSVLSLITGKDPNCCPVFFSSYLFQQTRM